MEQCKIKILWIDDDIFRRKLQPYVDELNENGFEIIGVANPDDIDMSIDLHSDIQCIIVDISMPIGKSINANEAKMGMRTGLVVLQNLNNNANLNHIKKVIFTVTDDDVVRAYCNDNGVPYLQKQNYLTDTFVKEIKRILKSTRKTKK